jgi:DNA-binding Lrp family transcriptional regulator
MKRDMDLVREILMEIEKGGPSTLGEVHIEGYSSEEVSYHVRLMGEAGLIEASGTQINAGPNASPDAIEWEQVRLTWAGHEFLDASRNDTMWAKAKDKVLSTTGTLTLDALKMALGALIKQALTGGK